VSGIDMAVGVLSEFWERRRACVNESGVVPGVPAESRKLGVARAGFGRSEEKVSLFGHSGVPGDTDLSFGVMHRTRAENGS
jgi:hypothetical protein